MKELKLTKRPDHVATTPYKIYSSADWTKLFSITQGLGFEMSASGDWQYDPGRPQCGPGGNGVLVNSMPDPNAPQGCLLWKHLGNPNEADSGYFPGSSSIVGEGIAHLAFGDYYFRINDDNLSDNGSTYLTVSLWTYPATSP